MKTNFIFQETISLIKREKYDIYKLYFLAFASAFLGLCLPLGVQFFVNFLIFRALSFSMIVLIIFVILALFFQGWVNIINLQVIEKLSQKIFSRYTLLLEQHLCHIDTENTEPEHFSQKINYVMEVGQLEKSIAKLFKDIPKASLEIVLSIFLLSLYHPIFIFLSLFSLLLLVFFWRVATPKGFLANLDKSKTKYELFTAFQEIALQFRFLKNIHQKKYSAQEIEALAIKYLYKKTRYFFILRSQYITLLVGKIFLIALMFILGLILVQNDSLNLGQFLAAEIILVRMLYSLEDLVFSLDDFFSTLSAKHKLDEVLNLKVLSENNPPILFEKTALWHKIYFLNSRLPIEKTIYFVILGLVASAFLPWTQNIESKGYVTTLLQNERPQAINSTISGKIKTWYIKEGSFVEKGDTLVHLEEIKVEYLDPLLLQRTQEQVQAKKNTSANYASKALATESQKTAFENLMLNKINQIQNKILQVTEKIKADSLDILASETDLGIAQKQLQRQKELYKEGLVSLTQLETKTQGMQSYTAKVQQAKAKLTYSQQELENLSIDIQALTQEYREKLAKLDTEQFQILAYQSSLEGEIAKLENQFKNYELRHDMYFILAPQAGQITKIEKSGIGQIIKEDEKLLEIVPKSENLGLEIFIPARDVPLLRIGQKTMLIFDGFPAIVFSGWPKGSYGTFEGSIVSIENKSNEKGFFRVLVSPEESKKLWPKQLRIGTAIRSFVLLKNVFLGYEIWRQVNGFPPDYYTVKDEKKDEKK